MFFLWWLESIYLASDNIVYTYYFYYTPNFRQSSSLMTEILAMVANAI